MEGWIKLHRRLLDNPVVCKDAETLGIWIYLLTNATHKKIPAIFKGQKIVLEEGQLITGIISISKKLKINKDKVQRTLKCFELDNQIEQETSNKNRLISILNWNKYQSVDKQFDKQMINKCETNDKQLITNKNERNKECKNINSININKEKELKLFNSGDAFSQYLIEQGYTEDSFNELSEREQEMISENYILGR